MAPLPTTPKRLQTLVRSELAAYGEVIKRAGIKLEQLACRSWLVSVGLS